MTSREVRKYLFDIAEAGERIREFTFGKTFSDYANDALLRSAVERQFAIIGEAVNKASRWIPRLGPKPTYSPATTRQAKFHFLASSASRLFHQDLQEFLLKLVLAAGKTLDKLTEMNLAVVGSVRATETIVKQLKVGLTVTSTRNTARSPAGVLEALEAIAKLTEFARTMVGKGMVK